jgi:hypothetical protein
MEMRTKKISTNAMSSWMAPSSFPLATLTIVKNIPHREVHMVKRIRNSRDFKGVEKSPVGSRDKRRFSQIVYLGTDSRMPDGSPLSNPSPLFERAPFILLITLGLGWKTDLFLVLQVPNCLL